METYLQLTTPDSFLSLRSKTKYNHNYNHKHKYNFVGR